jgi:hypothetical protein
LFGGSDETLHNHHDALTLVIVDVISLLLLLLLSALDIVEVAVIGATPTPPTAATTTAVLTFGLELAIGVDVRRARGGAGVAATNGGNDGLIGDDTVAEDACDDVDGTPSDTAGDGSFVPNGRAIPIAAVVPPICGELLGAMPIVDDCGNGGVTTSVAVDRLDDGDGAAADDAPVPVPVARFMAAIDAAAAICDIIGIGKPIIDDIAILYDGLYCND